MFEVTPESPAEDRLRFIATLAYALPIRWRVTLQISDQHPDEKIRGRRITGQIFSMPGGACSGPLNHFNFSVEGGGVCDLHLDEIVRALYPLDEFPWEPSEEAASEEG